MKHESVRKILSGQYRYMVFIFSSINEDTVNAVVISK